MDGGASNEYNECPLDPQSIFVRLWSVWQPHPLQLQQRSRPFRNERSTGDPRDCRCLLALPEATLLSGASGSSQAVQLQVRHECRNRCNHHSHDTLERFDGNLVENVEVGGVDDVGSAVFGDDDDAHDSEDHEAVEVEVLDCSTFALEVLKLRGSDGRRLQLFLVAVQLHGARRILGWVLWRREVYLRSGRNAAVRTLLHVHKLLHSSKRLQYDSNHKPNDVGDLRSQIQRAIHSFEDFHRIGSPFAEVGYCSMNRCSCSDYLGDRLVVRIRREFHAHRSKLESKHYP